MSEKLIVNDVNYDKLTPRLLVMGDCVHPCMDYVAMLRQIGYSVYWIGKGADGLDTKNLPLGYWSTKEYEEFGLTVFEKREISLSSILDMVGTDFQAILHFQDWNFPPDKQKSPIPYLYYATEGWFPKIPQCAWGYFGATLALIKAVQYHQPHAPSLLDYLPYCLSNHIESSIFMMGHKRTIAGSFCGKIDRFGFLYDRRREILPWLAENCKGFQGHWPADVAHNLPQVGEGFLDAEPYTKLLKSSLCGINVPTIGGFNFRDLEIPACGAMLLTIPTPDLYTLGFKDGVNCRFYNTKEQAKRIIEDEYDSEIAMRGYLLVHSQHRVFHRIAVIENTFLKLGLRALAMEKNMWRYNENREIEFLMDNKVVSKLGESIDEKTIKPDCSV